MIVKLFYDMNWYKTLHSSKNKTGEEKLFPQRFRKLNGPSGYGLEFNLAFDFEGFDFRFAISNFTHRPEIRILQLWIPVCVNFWPNSLSLNFRRSTWFGHFEFHISDFKFAFSNAVNLTCRFLFKFVFLFKKTPSV